MARKKIIKEKDIPFLNNLKWYVLNYNFNANKLENWNIFHSSSFKEYTYDLLNKFVSYEDFKEELRKKLMYCFWSKREYEIFVGDAFEEDIDKYEKIDVYSQVLPNLDILAKYLIDEWNNRK